MNNDLQEIVIPIVKFIGVHGGLLIHNLYTSSTINKHKCLAAYSFYQWSLISTLIR